jgi:hypothetical protein
VLQVFAGVALNGDVCLLAFADPSPHVNISLFLEGSEVSV